MQAGHMVSDSYMSRLYGPSRKTALVFLLSFTNLISAVRLHLRSGYQATLPDERR